MSDLSVTVSILRTAIEQAEKSPVYFPALDSHLAELRGILQQACERGIGKSEELKLPTYEDQEKVRAEIIAAGLREALEFVGEQVTAMKRRKEAGQLTDADKTLTFEYLMPILKSAKEMAERMK